MTLRFCRCLVSALAVLFAGCASRDLVHERGWLGGKLVRAEPASWKTPTHSSEVIGAFPGQLQPEHRAGLVVLELAPDSPLAKAGLQESDLILSLNGAPVRKSRAFQKEIEEMSPGAPVELLVYRNGELLEKTAVVGKEKFRHVGNITMGIGLSSHLEFDLLPDPDFSLVALGFKRNHDRLQLQSPRRDYIRGTEAETPAESGVDSQEGWRVWLAVLSVSDHKKILSQEAIQTPSAAARVR